jgi:hypothetical protein
LHFENFNRECEGVQDDSLEFREFKEFRTIVEGIRVIRLKLIFA